MASTLILKEYERQKQLIRVVLKQKIALLSEHERLQKSSSIQAKLNTLPAFQRAKSVLLFVSKEDEVFTHDLIKSFLGYQKVGVPKMGDAFIVPTEITSWGGLVPGSYGILEPRSSTPMQQIDIILVPGLAFDLFRFRLGRGLGCYDKFLRSCYSTKVGLCFEEQIVSQLPHEQHDIPMDIIVTESRVL